MDIRLASAGIAAALLTATITTASALQPTESHRTDEALVAAFGHVSRSTVWTRTATIPLDFDTFHPQSMEVVGDRIYLSSVEILERPVRYPEPVDGYDRSPGKGIGHLFVLDLRGTLLHDIVLGEGDRYHPGGIDVDDRGGVIRDRRTGHLVGQSWGSRRFYDWTLGGRQTKRWLNENHLLDYQDCEYVASRKALCSGVTGLPAQPGAATGYELGGFVMIDLADRHRILHEVPLQLWSTAGHVITRNPTDLDADVSGGHLTLYAAPDDSDEGAGTEILVYEADVVR